MTNYNPFSTAGRDNIRRLVYDHKNEVIGVIVLMMVLLLALGAYVWLGTNGRTGSKASRLGNLPAPSYGYGPFGYGTYAPPESYFD